MGRGGARGAARGQAGAIGPHGTAVRVARRLVALDVRMCLPEHVPIRVLAQRREHLLRHRVGDKGAALSEKPPAHERC